MLGAAESNAFGAKLPGESGIGRGIGVGAHADLAHAICPAHQPVKGIVDLGGHGRNFAQHHFAGSAVDGDHIPLFDESFSDAHGAFVVVDGERRTARDAALAHPSRHHGGVRGHAAASGQDPFGCIHAADVLGRCFHPDQDHLFAGLGAHVRALGVEDHHPHPRTGRGRQAARDHIANGLGVQRGMQEFVQGGGVDPQDGFVAGNQALLRHIDGDFDRRAGRALAGASLKHPELALLNGKFDVLHVSVVLFQTLVDAN